MGDRVSGHGFQDTRVSGGTVGYSGIRGCTGVAFPLAQFFVQSGPIKGITRGEGAYSGHRAPASEVRVRVRV